MSKFYINAVEVKSNNFVLKNKHEYSQIQGFITDSNEEEAYFKLHQSSFNEYYLKLSFSTREYPEAVTYRKFIKVIELAQKQLKTLSTLGTDIYIDILEDWNVTFLEISKSIQLKHQYYKYIDTIKSITPSNKRKYSIIGTYEDDSRIYFNSKPKDDSKNYNTYIRFESKDKTEKTLECMLMMKGHYLHGYTPEKSYFKLSEFYKYFNFDSVREREDIDLRITTSLLSSTDYKQITLKDIISDYKKGLLKCGNYFTSILSDNLFTENFTAIEEIKDDTKLLDYTKDSENDSRKRIYLFIIIKLLSELKDYNILKISRLLKCYPDRNIKDKRAGVLKVITKYRNTYRKNYKAYSTEELYNELKDKVLTE